VKIIQEITQSHGYQKISRIIRTVTLPGFKGIPLYNLGVFIYEEAGNNSIQVRAAATAYHSILAVFPGILFLFFMISYLPLNDFRDTLFEILWEVLPYSTHNMVYEIINDLSDNSFRGGGIFSVLLSLGVSLYFASNGVRSLMDAFKKVADPDFVRRKFLRRQAVSVGLTLLLLVILVGTITGIIIGKYGINLAIRSLNDMSHFNLFFLSLLRTTMVFFLVFNSIALIYYLAPATKQQWKYFTPGAFVATLGFILSTRIFAYIVNNFSNYDKFYGSLAALIIIMVWFHITSYILIICFELNVAILSENRARSSTVAYPNDPNNYYTHLNNKAFFPEGSSYTENNRQIED